MSLLERAPNVSVAHAVRLAREHYGLDAQAQPLVSERDQNFLLDTPRGRFVLKLANGAERRSTLEAQNAAMAHLAGTGLCPTVVPALDGSEIVQDQSGHFCRLLTWLPGVPLATLRRHSPALLEELGRRLGDIDRSLADFDHPALHRELHWDLARAFEQIEAGLPEIGDVPWGATIACETERIGERVAPLAAGLRQSIVHNDANDHNVLVESGPGRTLHERRVSGLVDFGDMVRTWTVADPAIAIAYAVLDKPDPLSAAAAVVRGYHSSHALRDDEFAVLFDLVKLRLCLSASLAARQQRHRPADEYLTVSQAAIRRTLPTLIVLHPRFVEAAFRQACGLAPSRKSDRIIAWLKNRPAPHLDFVGGDRSTRAASMSIDLGVASPLVEGDPDANDAELLGGRIERAMAAENAAVAVGGYLEPRILYSSRLFGDAGAGDRRTVHLGLDFFAPAGSPVRAALSGVVQAFADNRQPLDYGPVVILGHRTDAGDEFYTLYGHLTRDTLAGLRKGASVEAGEVLGAIGQPAENGGWAPHLHFQLITDLLELGCDFPGVCRPSESGAWAAFSPDPGLVVHVPQAVQPRHAPDARAMLAARRARIGASIRVAYREPLEIVRGWKQYVYDASGRRFLDAYNNVPHVGHCHPRVVRAAEAQMRVLSTNTRYLHEALERFARDLSATLPAPLRVCYFVNSGSEANELALRLARAHTRRTDVVVLEAAYHGNTTTLTQISPYKFDGPGGEGRASWVHVAPLPDVYRGPHRDPDSAGRQYADRVRSMVEPLHASGGVAAFIAESAPSAAGQILFPAGYLARVYADVRAAGGVCIADEVQTAYGRMGTHLYGFEAQAVVPDIVTLGKPIGNGYPLGAVVTTPEIAASFDNGMEFFSTFGGSTVSCAAGIAVLEVVRQEHLQAHAEQVGRRLGDALRDLATRHTIVGDVRGSGLFVGVDLVTDRESRAAATAEADHVVNRLREEGILVGTDGVQHNVLKIRPPMPFSVEDVEYLTATLDSVLCEL